MQFYHSAKQSVIVFRLFLFEVGIIETIFASDFNALLVKPLLDFLDLFQSLCKILFVFVALHQILFDARFDFRISYAGLIAPQLC